MKFAAAALIALTVGAAGNAFAAPAAKAVAAPHPASATPEWPCETEPAPTLTAADIWAAAGTPSARNWRSDATLARLVADVAPRSVPVPEAGLQLQQFAARQPNPDVARARLAAGLIETIDAERRIIINGIRRFNGRQDQLARRIEQGYVDLDSPAAKAALDNPAAKAALDNPAAKAAAERRAAADEQVQWDTRIMEDRQRMLPLVCRQPDALETRLNALISALRAPPELTVSAAVPSGYLVYATNEGSGDISVIDPATQLEVARIAIGKRPRGLVASPDGKLLYVAVSGSPIAGPGVDESKLPPPDRAADGIVVIDLGSRQVLRTLRGISDPEQIAISADGERLYVASEDTGQLIIISSGGAMLGTLAVGSEPEGVSVSPDGHTILATSEGDHSLAIVRGTPLAVVGRVEVGERPRNALFLAPDRVVVPGEFDASLSVVDLKAQKRLRTITLRKEDRPMGVARLNPSTMLLTTGRGGRLVRVDVDAPGNPVTGFAVVGPRPWGLALAPDAGLAFTANGSSNDVSIVDPRTMSVIAKVDAGKGPWGIAAVRMAGVPAR